MERRQGQHETFRDYVSDMHNLHFKLKHKIDEDEFVELLKDNILFFRLESSVSSAH